VQNICFGIYFIILTKSYSTITAWTLSFTSHTDPSTGSLAGVGVCLAIIATDGLEDLDTDAVTPTWTLAFTSHIYPGTGGLAVVGVGLVVGPTNGVKHGWTDAGGGCGSGGTDASIKKTDSIHMISSPFSTVTVEY